MKRFLTWYTRTGHAPQMDLPELEVAQGESLSEW
jgi:hypothetical protein